MLLHLTLCHHRNASETDHVATALANRSMRSHCIAMHLSHSCHATSFLHWQCFGSQCHGRRGWDLLVRWIRWMVQGRLWLGLLLLLLALGLLQYHGWAHLHAATAKRLPFQVATMLRLDNELCWLLVWWLIAAEGRVVRSCQVGLWALELPLVFSQSWVFYFQCLQFAIHEVLARALGTWWALIAARRHASRLIVAEMLLLSINRCWISCVIFYLPLKIIVHNINYNYNKMLVIRIFDCDSMCGAAACD